jgi:hypothetical protein
MSEANNLNLVRRYNIRSENCAHPAKQDECSNSTKCYAQATDVLHMDKEAEV